MNSPGSSNGGWVKACIALCLLPPPLRADDGADRLEQAARAQSESLERARKPAQDAPQPDEGAPAPMDFNPAANQAEHGDSPPAPEADPDGTLGGNGSLLIPLPAGNLPLLGNPWLAPANEASPVPQEELEEAGAGLLLADVGVLQPEVLAAFGLEAPALEPWEERSNPFLAPSPQPNLPPPSLPADTHTTTSGTTSEEDQPALAPDHTDPNVTFTPPPIFRD